ncbi:hypothetical protein NDU88_006042 [Pleurodeles waltl]|uniref:Uncharacterized protein n=1 Tax=Pleurodeles waltl TaxID=8319 RepID=A0AAV7PJZ0_PLEWA|nr:hypothetical protein NDU88_006042 [Pleurodeles waltl]
MRPQHRSRLLMEPAVLRQCDGEQGAVPQQTGRRRQGNGFVKDVEGEEESRDAEKVKDGDAEAGEERRNAKEQKEGSGRETTRTEDIGVRQQGTPHWNAHQDN